MKGEFRKKIEIIIILFIVLFISFPFPTCGVPIGASIDQNVTESANLPSAGSITTPGGTFTTLILNVSQQDYQWKAYVGNVTGKLTLDDSDGYTIYDWTLSSINGEVYASRSNTIDWTNIGCASQTVIANEETALGISSSDVDSINNTFNYTAHKSFQVGTVSISENSCRSIATYVNSNPQQPSSSADFQEVLLSDNTHLIYTALINPSTQGFDNGLYDFQMIVAENESSSTGNTYYFWVELG